MHKVDREDDVEMPKVRANLLDHFFPTHIYFLSRGRHAGGMLSGSIVSVPRVLTLGTTEPSYHDRCTRAPVGKERSSAPGGFGRPSAPMSASCTCKPK